MTEASVSSFTIFHTNDFHNRLTEAQAERLRHLRRSAGESGLLLDAGDAVGSGNITFRPGGELVHDLMNRAEYDAGTVGNREYHFSGIGFRTKLSRAQFPLLCANARRVSAPLPNWTPEEIDSVHDGGAEAPIAPFVRFPSPSGFSVLVFGLTVPMITERMLSRKVAAYVFEEPIRLASELVPRLKERYPSDLIVALTHIGLRKDRELAERGLGIDLIIGGHSHDRLEYGDMVGDTLIVQTGCYAKAVGRIEIRGSVGKWERTERLEDL